MASFDSYFREWARFIDKNKLFKIINTLNTEYKVKSIMPKYENIFKCFEYCDYNNLKVIILGMDPYPQLGVATGIAFANNIKDGESTSLSPSLKIIKEACINYEVPHYFTNFDPTLISWEKQGVLLLNSALTVETNKPGSHRMLWRPFIASFLSSLSISCCGIIYVLLGADAKSFKMYINSKSSIILEANHPSYYARLNKRMPSSLFEDINNEVQLRWNTKIKWYGEQES